MKEIFLRDCANVRLMGRDNGDETAFPLFWSGSGLEVNARASSLEIEIDCAYASHKHYLSFEVDGLRAQTFAPLNGRHFYSVFLGLNAETTHHVRVIKETQPFAGDPTGYVRLITLRTDGEILPPPPRARRLEFVGDSITSGEGGRGPRSFMEWVPMMFCASDDYARFTADLLKADYQVVAQSGHGFLVSWDNRPEENMPDLYDRVCGVCAAGQDEYDFSFQPDAVVIALGTNDHSALNKPAYVDANGVAHKLTSSPEDCLRLEEAAHDFLIHIHRRNPKARLVWMLFREDEVILPAVQRAVSRAAAEGLRAELLVPYDIDHPIRGGMGSRSHPGPVAHKRIARALARLLAE